MDSYGVPRKINRHVLKAINFYMNQGNGSRFREIYHFVRLYNKNLVPVIHLKEAVLKSLNNLQRFGLVRKGANQKFRMRSGTGTRRLRKTPKVKRKKTARKESKMKRSRETQKDIKNTIKRDTATTSRKRSASMDDTGSESSVIKRLRGDKKTTVKDRKGKKVELPHARKYRQQSDDHVIPLNKAELGTDGSPINIPVQGRHSSPDELREAEPIDVARPQEAISGTSSQHSVEANGPDHVESNSPGNRSNISMKSETISHSSDLEENSGDPMQNSG